MKILRCIALTLVFCALSFAQEAPQPARGQTPPSPGESVGDTYGGQSRFFTLTRPGKQLIPIAGTREDYAAFWQLCTSQNQKGLREALEDEMVFLAEPNTVVKVLEYGSTYVIARRLELVRVRVLNGKYAGSEGWTQGRFLSRPMVAENRLQPKVQGEPGDLFLPGPGMEKVSTGGRKLSTVSCPAVRPAL